MPLVSASPSSATMTSLRAEDWVAAL